MNEQASGQFAVVTGASSGIGLELARLFAQNGFDLLIVAEDDGISRAAEEIRSEGAKVDSARIDLATRSGVDELCHRIDSAGRPVDAIAINAGVGVSGAFVDTELQEELDMIALNVVSVVHLAKHVLRGMVARNEGRMLFTSSIAAESPHPFMAVYAATKSFVQSFAEAIRNEVKETNVVITALQPGATETNFFARANMEDTKVGAREKLDPATVAREGFEAMMKGKDHVVSASKKEKAQVIIGHVTPQTIQAEQARKETEPGSAG